MELIMLGTGHAMVQECYNTCFVIQDGASPILVDAGGGGRILGQLQKAQVDWRDIHHLVVTHRHLDHILGVAWFFRMRLSGKKHPEDPGLTIYGNREVIAALTSFVEDLFLEEVQDLGNGTREVVGFHLWLQEVLDGETRAVGEGQMTFFDIHSTQALQDGFLYESSDGLKLCCLGDEPGTDYSRPYAVGADILMHEAFCLEAEADRYHPHDKQHSTAAGACRYAASVGARNLILYHTEEEHLAERKALYTAEGAPLFPGNLFVPDDLERLTF